MTISVQPIILKAEIPNRDLDCEESDFLHDFRKLLLVMFKIRGWIM